MSSLGGSALRGRRRGRRTSAGACGSRRGGRWRSTASSLIADPDGIVVDARFVPAGRLRPPPRGCSHRGCASRWRTGWASAGWASRPYRYHVEGADRASLGGDPPLSAPAGPPPAARRARSSTSTWTRSSSPSRCAGGPSWPGEPVVVGGTGRAGRGGRGVLRGAALRRPLGDAVDAGPPAVPARRVPARRPRRATSAASREVHEIFRVLHAARRADRARRGLPRRHRRPAAVRLRRRDRRRRSAGGSPTSCACRARSGWRR